MGLARVIFFITAVVLIFFTGAACAEGWTVKQLTDNQADFRPDISGDGAKVVFTRSFDNAVDCSGNEIMLYDMTTNKITRLTNDAYYDDDATISKDGKVIAYLKKKVSGSESIKSLNLLMSDGKLKTIEGPSVKGYALSGDGSKVLVLSSDMKGDYMKLYNTNTLDFKTLKGLGNIGEISLNNDGTRIAYSYEDDKYKTKVAVMDAASGAHVGQVDDFPSTYVGLIKISADGSRVITAGDGLWAMNAVGTGLKKLSSYVCAAELNNDGSRVFFILIAKENGVQKGKLYAINWDGSGQQLISQDNVIYSNLYAQNFISASGDGNTVIYNTFIDTKDRYWCGLAMASNPASMTYMVFSNVAFSLLPSTDGTVRFSSANGKSGNVTIPVTITTIKNVGSMNFELGYDSRLLKVTGVDKGSLDQNALFVSNVEGEKIRVGIVDSTGFTGSGSIATVTFAVQQDAGIGQCPLTVKEVTGSDVASKALTFDTIDGEFSVAGSRGKGDLNGDGQISSVDALMALKMSVGALTVDLSADMDGDGKVMARDALDILNAASGDRIGDLGAMLQDSDWNREEKGSTFLSPENGIIRSSRLEEGLARGGKSR